MIFDVMDPTGSPPDVGDLLVSARLVKLVTDVRPVESRVWHDRWRVEARTLGPREPWPREAVEAALEPGARVIHTKLHEKGVSPAQLARQLGLPVRAG